jgi:hypothetical protein
VIFFGVVGTLLATSTPALAATVPATPNRTATFNNTVWATAYAGDVIYVGGDFTAAIVGGKSYPRDRLAAINAVTGALLNWAPSADGRVLGIAAAGGAVYVVGEFATVNNVHRARLAKLDTTGALSGGFAHTLSGVPQAVATGYGRLYLGGVFTAVDGQARSRLAAFNLASGALDGGWQPVADEQVDSIVAAQGAGRVYLAGRFHTINGVSGSSRVAAVSPDTAAYDRGFRPAASYQAYAVAIGRTGVYAALGGPGGRVIGYGFSGAKQWELTTDGDVQAVTVLDDVVYFGGHFDNSCRSPRTGDKGACLDGSDRRVKLAAAGLDGALLGWTADGNGIDGVHTMAASARLGAVAAGGAFTTINGASQLRFAQFR